MNIAIFLSSLLVAFFAGYGIAYLAMTIGVKQDNE